MNLERNIIIVDGTDKTYQVESIQLEGDKYAIRFQNSDKIYTYTHDRVIWLTHPIAIDIEACHVMVNGKRERNVKALHRFAHYKAAYFAITYDNGFVKHCPQHAVEVRRSCLRGDAKNLFEYLRQCAEVNTLGADEEEESSKGILSSIYSRVDFIDEATAASVYLRPYKEINQYRPGTPLFPFGCNANQSRAVNAALTNQISVIQGPPGTGKTQTILNIIANLLKDGKTMLVVSSNNSATENVYEKLSKNGFGFVVASLGKRENKEAFITNQPRLNPKLPLWRLTPRELSCANAAITDSFKKIEEVFKAEERLAVCRQELADVEIEMSHYRQEHPHISDAPAVKVSSTGILKILHKIKAFELIRSTRAKGLLKRIKRIFTTLSLRLCLRFTLDIKRGLSRESLPSIILWLQEVYYICRRAELKSEIESLEQVLSRLDSKRLMKSLTDSSLQILKASLATRYGKERPIIASVKDLFNNANEVLEQYPIILSTTFSARTCFNSDTLFDYVIMDEASQVSVETGLLALTCAKNAVIVGDTMQLPNVVTEVDRAKLNVIRQQYRIPDCYDAAAHSFLSSVIATFPGSPTTLLREHYRCHPDIINFCNQKFYGGSLLIMSRREDDYQPLVALTTTPGQHCRGHYNQREIDAVKLKLLPLLCDPEQTGIIAPYNSQVNEFRSQLPHIEAATVHKYQGREKDTIILSVTDDLITEFADDANLLNVAVSRAKKKFCLVVSGNPQNLKGNINDLIHYIRYRQGSLLQSPLHSIFDYLFTQIHHYEKETEQVSEYPSENMTFELIEKIRSNYPRFSHIKAIPRYPLRQLVHDMSGLSEQERKYATHPSTHIDFLIINRVTKAPLLAIETDGYSFHKPVSRQSERDRMKDNILNSFGLPLLRLSTVGHSEEQKIVSLLGKILHKLQ